MKKNMKKEGIVLKSKEDIESFLTGKLNNNEEEKVRGGKRERREEEELGRLTRELESELILEKKIKE
jgi:hypothetical protein